MVRAHRQAWTWQDEWFNLTMEDIRELERQTQAALAKKMGSTNGSSMEEAGESSTMAALTTPPMGGGQDATDKGQSGQSTGARTPVSPGGPPSWPISCISESSSDDDEFFDCQDSRSTGALSPAMVRWSSMELIPQGEDGDEDQPDKVQEERIEVRFQWF